MNAPTTLVRLPIVGSFRCDTLHCVVTPTLCAARAKAKSPVRFGTAQPRFPMCAACPIGQGHAGDDAAKRIAPRKHPSGHKPSVKRAPSQPAPCSRCNLRPVARDLPSTPAEEKGKCGKCRALIRGKARREARNARLAAAKAALPPCSRCGLNPPAQVREGTPIHLHGMCSPCRLTTQREAQREAERATR